MNRKTLDKLYTELDNLRLRKRNLTSRELESFAKKCGRRLSNRGKEPTYVSDYFPYLRPVSIPNHPGNISVGTAGNILSFLEQDLFEWDEKLER
jgi:hypothetical protein